MLVELFGFSEPFENPDMLFTTRRRELRPLFYGRINSNSRMQHRAVTSN